MGSFEVLHNKGRCDAYAGYKHSFYSKQFMGIA
jgi:hypothetical protein